MPGKVTLKSRPNLNVRFSISGYAFFFSCIVFSSLAAAFMFFCVREHDL